MVKWAPAEGYPGLPGGAVVYAIGDIHGCDHLLELAHLAIDEDRQKAAGDAHEIYLGDYIDRGPSSCEVVERLVARARIRSVQFVRGNHEAMLEGFLARRTGFAAWRSVGGDATAESYGLDVSAAAIDEDELRRRLGALIPSTHIAFFAGLQGSVAVGDYFFTHAGVRPGVSLDAQRLEDLMWIRGEFLRYHGSFGKIVVHGHTPAPQPELRLNRINLDTMAYASGTLTCLRIDASGASVALLRRGLGTWAWR